MGTSFTTVTVVILGRLSMFYVQLRKSGSLVAFFSTKNVDFEKEGFLGVRLGQGKIDICQNWHYFLSVYTTIFSKMIFSAASLLGKSYESAKLGHFFYERPFFCYPYSRIVLYLLHLLHIRSST